MLPDAPENNRGMYHTIHAVVKMDFAAELFASLGFADAFGSLEADCFAKGFKVHATYAEILMGPPGSLVSQGQDNKSKDTYEENSRECQMNEDLQDTHSP